MSDLTHRLNQILPKLTSDDFLRARGIGNEIAFYIFDYAPEDELRVREHIRFLVDRLPKSKPGLRVAHINLFEFLIHYLKARRLLEKSFELQRKKGSEALLKALKGVLDEGKIARRFADIARPAEHDLVLLSGVGGAYPLLRSHTLLNNLHPIMGQTPLVMFYPGRYDAKTLRLFGKIGFNYYRAFRLIE